VFNNFFGGETMKKITIIASLALIGIAISNASAVEVTSPFSTTFSDAAAPSVDTAFNDFGAANPVTPLGANGTAPGATVAGGKLVVYSRTDFEDVGVGTVQFSAGDIASAVGFIVSTTVNVSTFEFNNARVGVTAFAVNPALFGREFAGYQAYVREELVPDPDTRPGRYSVVILNGNTQVASSAFFNLTDGSPDFTITLAGVETVGGVDLTASFTDLGGNNVIPAITTTVSGVFPSSNNFGVRAQSGFNTFEVAFDSLSVSLTPIPEPAWLAAILTGAGMLLRRRAK
jgi:hypothetical protein